MKKTLQIINQMQKEGLFSKYAIGGGIGALFYIEPFVTFDIDIFVIIKRMDNKGLILLSPIYKWIKKKAYKTEKEQIIIEGIPVQFIPAYNELVKEAVENAAETNYEDVKTFVLKAEYLFVIMLQTNRPKDRERMIRFVEQADISNEIVEEIVIKHNLKQEYKEFRRRYLNE